MAKKKKPLSDLYKYIKLRVESASELGVSPYEIACRALAVDGRPKPGLSTYRQWAIKNIGFMTQESERIKHASVDKIPKQNRKQNCRPSSKAVDVFISNSKIDPASDDFLISFEWRATRMMALKKYGPVCQCCGASPKTGAVMNVDHVKPRKFFPSLALSLGNLQILCGDCNHGKGNWDATDWRS